MTMPTKTKRKGKGKSGPVGYVGGELGKVFEGVDGQLGRVLGMGNPKAVGDMSASEINKAMDKLSELDSRLTTEMIEAGRGYERPSETFDKSDPLAMRMKELYSRRMALVNEIERRAGPGMRRLPKGFGPMKRNPRGLTETQMIELIKLYHLARTALSGKSDTPYDRMLWAAKEFVKEHPEVSNKAAYLALSDSRHGNPAKFDRCVREAEGRGEPGNAYAICTAAGTRNPEGPQVGETWEYSYRGRKGGKWRTLTAVSMVVAVSGNRITFADGRTITQDGGDEGLVRMKNPNVMEFTKREGAEAYARLMEMEGWTARIVRKGWKWGVSLAKSMTNPTWGKGTERWGAIVREGGHQTVVFAGAEGEVRKVVEQLKNEGKDASSARLRTESGIRRGWQKSSTSTGNPGEYRGGGPGTYNILDKDGNVVGWDRSGKEAKFRAQGIGGRAVKVAAVKSSQESGHEIKMPDGTFVPMTKKSIKEAQEAWRKKNPYIDVYGPPFNTPATSGFARYENENGYASGEATALGGKPMASREDMKRNMPNSLLNGPHADAFIDLRYQAYQQGYESVNRYVAEKYSKKDADSQAASLQRTGFHVLGVKKEKREHGTAFMIEFTGKKGQNMPQGAKRNPEDEAAEMYEAFHGTPSEEVVEFEDTIHYHKNLAQLGMLAGMLVETETNGTMAIAFSGYRWDNKEKAFEEDKRVDVSKTTILASNETGTQLFFRGDQELKLDQFKFSKTEASKEVVTIGDVEMITYHARKIFDGKEEEYDYFHEFSEDDGAPLPKLIYHTLSKTMTLAGGAYKIEKPLIGTSPGIEN